MENSNQNQKFISVSDMFYACLARWKWVLLSVIICLSLGYLYIKTTAPTYLRFTSVLLLNCGTKAGNYADVDLEALGLQAPNTSLQNEMEMLHSPVIMQKVVQELNLDVQYTYPGPFFDKVLYGAEIPVKVMFSDASADGVKFKINCVDKSNITLYDFNVKGEESTQINAKLGSAVKTPCGDLIVFPTSSYNPDSKFKQTVQVQKSKVSTAAEGFLENLKVENKDDKSSVVNVSIVDQNTGRAEDILNHLMVAYDENWKKTQNRIVENTSQFLADRVREVGTELGHVDDDIAAYKGANLMPDAVAAQGMYMGQNNTTQTSIDNYNTQLSMLHYMRNYLLNSMGSNRTLPSNIGISDPAISNLINSYNTLQMQRNEMVTYAGEDHPKIKELDQQINVLRSSITEAIDQSASTIQKQIAGLQKLAGKTAGKIVTSTQQEKVINSSTRDQKVKETLYIFLLQEKEKTDMTINHSISNIRVIQEAGGSNAPIAPLKRQIMLLAFVIGIGIPFIIIFLLEITETKVRSRKDIESLTAPFLGEIPMATQKQGFFAKLTSKLRKSKHSQPIKIYVEQNSRDIVNEGFRMVRTNLEFMLQKDKERKVILFTSANPASGKSFISSNLAKSMSLLGKKMLLIDMDMRRCTVSSLISHHQRHGLANYLGNSSDNLDDIICKNAIGEGVDILPVGTVPPNPTELLHDERLGKLMQAMRERYDYIIVDCPPIDIVADVDIVNQFSDMTIFVIRAGVMERDWIPEINKIYENNRFNNLCTLLNGTLSGNAYSRHRYGGYYGHYNYGYYGSTTKD